MPRAETLLTPEDLDVEHRAIARTIDEFWAREVEPNLDALRRHEPGVGRALLVRAAALGLTGLQVPERFGGLGLDLRSVIVAVEHLATDASYLGWHLGHIGIGTLPLVYFGTEDQQQRYLPRLASLELLAAYALTEPHAGSDALAARTRADLSADGRHYVLNGQKAWITNGGEADLFTVFAKVGGEAFTAFLVERSFGVTSGPEEHKMGITGTSTTPLYFDNVRVPAENVLGEIGRGHEIALNVLNVGRLEIGPLAVRGARQILDTSIEYARSRRAFGHSIAEYGAIQRKVADCAIGIFMTESAMWRVVGLIEDYVASEGGRAEQGAAAPPTDAAWLGAAAPAMRKELSAFREFAAECAMIKVFGSEMLDEVADEGVQIHGGYGYHRDYFVERAYRDARINRIFEGTNEINRLAIPTLLLKRAARSGLPLLQMGAARFDNTLEPAAPATDEADIVANAKTVALMLLTAAHRRHGDAVREHQEVLMDIADTIIETFVLESGVLRSRKLALTGGAGVTGDMCAVYAREVASHVAHAAHQVLPAVMDGAELARALAVVRGLTACTPVDVFAARRRVATALLS